MELRDSWYGLLDPGGDNPFYRIRQGELRTNLLVIAALEAAAVGDAAVAIERLRLAHKECPWSSGVAGAIDEIRTAVELPPQKPPEPEPASPQLSTLPEKPPESSQATREVAEQGVSLRDLAMLIEEDDQVATTSVRKWIDSKKIKASPIGKCPLDGRAQLYRLSELLSDVGKILSLNNWELSKYRQALASKLRYPAAE
jgi:hypothetical protein